MAVTTPEPLKSSTTSEATQLPPEAQRALREAEDRRLKAAKDDIPAPAEHGGRNGPDPVRFGDWEKGGIASDF